MRLPAGNMSGQAIFRAGLWAVVALVAGAAVALFFLYNRTGPSAGNGPYGVPFQLVDQTGAPFSRKDLRGEPSALFFGYTHCPDVCPTTLYELAGYQKQITAEGGKFRIVFVTVDPERDTPKVMADYVSNIGGDVVAISGDPDKVRAMLKGWGAYFQKVGGGDDYTMDHTATTLLIGSDGTLEGTLAYGEKPKVAKAKLERLAGVSTPTA